MLLLSWAIYTYVATLASRTISPYCYYSEHRSSKVLSREYSPWNYASSRVAIASKYTSPSDPLDELQNNCDTGTYTDDWQDNTVRTSPFKVAKCVLILSNTQASESVKIRSTRLIYMAPHPSLIRNRMVIPASGIVNFLPHLPTRRLLANFSKKRTMLPKELLIGAGTDLTEVTVHLDQASTILFEDRKGDNKSVA